MLYFQRVVADLTARGEGRVTSEGQTEHDVTNAGTYRATTTFFALFFFLQDGGKRQNHKTRDTEPVTSGMVKVRTQRSERGNRSGHPWMIAEVAIHHQPGPPSSGRDFGKAL